MNKYTLPFVDCDCRIPFVKLTTTDGKEIYALVDCGSETTLLDKSFKKTFPGIIQSCAILGKTTRMGFGGEQEVVVLEAVAKIPLKSDNGDEGKLEFKGNIEDISALKEHLKNTFGLEWQFSMLIGSDLMKLMRATIDFRRRVLVLHDPPQRHRRF